MIKVESGNERTPMEAKGMGASVVASRTRPTKEGMPAPGRPGWAARVPRPSTNRQIREYSGFISVVKVGLGAGFRATNLEQ